MTEDDDYVEVDAVVRMPKGERLADSKKSEGWSRGFTPKSSEKGPEHVEIRLKPEGESSSSSTPRDDPPEPEFVLNTEYVGEPYETRDRDEIDELAQLLVVLALLKAAEWAQPRLKRLWNERVVPFLDTKREQWQRRRALRRSAGRVPEETEAAVIHAAPDAGSEGDQDGLGTALAAYETNMSSDAARTHFAEMLIAQRFVNEKMRLLANARIDGAAVPAELANAVEALTVAQVENALNSLLASTPNLVVYLEEFVRSGRETAPLELNARRITDALRLTDDDQ